MIAPSTRLFGLVTNDPADAWLARLFNDLYGFNRLDAAYLSFVLKPDVVTAALDGFLATNKTERLHVAPALWETVARWSGGTLPLVDTLAIRDGRATPSFETPRAVARLLAERSVSPGRVVVLGVGPLAQGLLALLPGATHLGAPAPRAAAPTADAAGPEATTAAATHDVSGFEVVVDAALPSAPDGLRVSGAPARGVLVAASTSLDTPRSRSWPASASLWSGLELWTQRARDETSAALDVTLSLLPDLDAAVREAAFRPCKLTHDAF